jgi:hypothetical protein
MFIKLRNGDDTQPLETAVADAEVTMLVGRTSDFGDALAKIGERIDRATFIVEDGVLANEIVMRWFGNDPQDVLVLLDYVAPRNAVKRYQADALPFDIGNDTLELEANS